MSERLRDALRRRGNNHAPARHGFQALTGLGWHDPAQPHLAAGGPVSVVIPARDVGHCLQLVLDALANQTARDAFEVIVVDDASTDDTTDIARAHDVVTKLIRIRERAGAATARNIGTAVAETETILYLDADMLLPGHVLAAISARAGDHLALIGFRHNLPFTERGQAWRSGAKPDLEADHRVRWRPPAGQRLMYSGLVLDEPLEGRPLDHTNDLLDLGFGRSYYDWDLPRMVVTALLAVPRHAVLDVGGFDPAFGRIGWGMEDTHLGAKLIASGLLVVPMRQAVGFHLDPPDAEAQWQTKLAAWPRTLEYYRRLLERPAPIGQAREFTTQLNALRSQWEVLR
ncbi:glycosyltransferase family 2 protein [Actinoallomurus sp. NBC_01490]|uniref:glycosyltransferase family 2 protein n=1 Tax=Actinoallomurus sp. NBC_01490 TaxID=2903557 RepID=UPI002E3759F5|nr:glycosyltransferase family 2 protein [Actinoallomurus sp. NBC_01490]